MVTNCCYSSSVPTFPWNPNVSSKPRESKMVDSPTDPDQSQTPKEVIGSGLSSNGVGALCSLSEISFPILHHITPVQSCWSSCFNTSIVVPGASWTHEAKVYQSSLISSPEKRASDSSNRAVFAIRQGTIEIPNDHPRIPDLYHVKFRPKSPFQFRIRTGIHRCQFPSLAKSWAHMKVNEILLKELDAQLDFLFIPQDPNPPTKFDRFWSNPTFLSYPWRCLICFNSADSWFQ